MDPQIGKAAFTIGLFITLLAAVMLPFQPRGSSEFVITGFTLVIGLLFLAVVIIMVRRSVR